MTPATATLRTSPGQPASETTKLLPPPRTKTSSFCSCAYDRASTISDSLRASAKYLAGPPTCKVVYEARGMFSRICTEMRLIHPVWMKSVRLPRRQPAHKIHAAGKIAGRFSHQHPESTDSAQNSPNSGEAQRISKESRENCVKPIAPKHLLPNGG